MNDVTVLAASADTRRGLTIGLFLVFIAITLYITFWASRQNKTAADFYAAGRSFSAFQNGLAIGGDYMSAASFLGIAGLIALYGYDGFLYSIGFLVAWLVALLLVAELMRNSGRYTMGDVLAFRMRQRPVRMAAGISTITVSIFYLIAQMVGAGALVALLLGISKTGQLPRHVPEHREERHHRARRRADDPLRHRRRHARHHLGADDQGRPAHDRRDPDVDLRAGQVQLQPVHPAGRGGRARAARATRSSTPGSGTAPATGRPRSTSSASASRWCSAPPACRTSSCASTRCRRPRTPAARSTGRSASSAPSTCSPSRSASAPRRWSGRARSAPPTPAATRRPRSWPRSSAAAPGPPAGRSSWRSSPRSRSPRSSPWSPGSRWRRRPRSRTTSTPT